jgi:hypothetical protein
MQLYRCYLSEKLSEKPGQSERHDRFCLGFDGYCE